jgi:hypothetical protein
MFKRTIPVIFAMASGLLLGLAPARAQEKLLS